MMPLDENAALAALAAAFPRWRFGWDTAGSWWAVPPTGYSCPPHLSADDLIDLAGGVGAAEAWEDAAGFFTSLNTPQKQLN